MVTGDRWGSDRGRPSGEQVSAAFGRITAGGNQRLLDTVVPTVVGCHWAHESSARGSPATVQPIIANDNQRSSATAGSTTVGGHQRSSATVGPMVVDDRWANDRGDRWANDRWQRLAQWLSTTTNDRQ